MAGKKQNADVAKAALTKAEKTPSKKRKEPPELEDFAPKTVLFTVQEKEFIVHKDLACHFSPFLSAAFNGSLAEGVNQTMKLEDTTKTAFSLFVRWIYSGKIENRSGQPPENNSDIIDLALLADKFLIPQLQDVGIQALFQHAVRTNTINTSDVRKVYKNTMPGSTLRKAMTDLVGLCLTHGPLSETLNGQGSDLPWEYLVDTINALRTKHGVVALTNLNIQDYMVGDVSQDG